MVEYDRAGIVDNNFTQLVSEGKLPPAQNTLSPQAVGLSKKMVLDLFDSQLKSRHLDLQARKLKTQQLAYYTIGSSGHEGNAVMGLCFPYSDCAFLHYRSGAFFIQRAKQLAGMDPVKDILLSLVASSKDPISGGRHKVFGSLKQFETI